jgi:hypothetical protein
VRAAFEEMAAGGREEKHVFKLFLPAVSPRPQKKYARKFYKRRFTNHQNPQVFA